MHCLHSAHMRVALQAQDKLSSDIPWKKGGMKIGPMIDCEASHYWQWQAPLGFPLLVMGGPLVIIWISILKPKEARMPLFLNANQDHSDKHNSVNLRSKYGHTADWNYASTSLGLKAEDRHGSRTPYSLFKAHFPVHKAIILKSFQARECLMTWDELCKKEPFQV